MLALPSQVVSLVISGDAELSVLHDIAEKARRELIAGGNVTQVEPTGFLRWRSVSRSHGKSSRPSVCRCRTWRGR